MYRHQILPFGKFQKQLIQNETSGNAFSIVPMQGACLLDLQFAGHPILDGCETPIELDLNNWGKSAILLPFPNRLNEGKYSWEGKEYQFDINDTQTNNAIHGFVSDQHMEITEISLDKKNAQLYCMYQYGGQNKAYPFPFTFTVKYDLKDDHTFEVTFFLSNEGNTAMPLGIGWHPYFRLSEKLDDMRLQFRGCDLVGLDERMIPTGKRYEYDEFNEERKIGVTVLDNCFAIKNADNGRFHLQLKGDQGDLNYWQETGEKKFNFIQLFTPPNRRGLAIEPMTCNIDAFNNEEGLITLAPGEEMEASFGLSFTPKQT